MPFVLSPPRTLLRPLPRPPPLSTRRPRTRPRLPPAASLTSPSPHTPLSTDAVLALSDDLSSPTDISTTIVLLRRHKLALLIDDLLHHVAFLAPHAPPHPIAALSALTATLLSHPSSPDDVLRADLRTALWNLRSAVEPLLAAPDAALASALEVVRGDLLDVPSARARDQTTLRADLHHLVVETLVLEELRSLRVLTTTLSHALADTLPPVNTAPSLALAAAATALRHDEYRVRGKGALLRAAHAFSLALPSPVPPPVAAALAALNTALQTSLATDDASRRPAGDAMLLRPRPTDIPNFAVVTPALLRGGQPNHAGIAWLLNCGVALVIDLRGSDRTNQWDGPDFVSDEHTVVARSTPSSRPRPRLRVRNLSMEDFGIPSFDQVLEFITLVDQAERDGSSCFLHCKAGIGRTGCMVACWRIANGEPVDDALAKESLYSVDGGGLKQEHFVRQFAHFLETTRE